jgi:hypothetical protein
MESFDHPVAVGGHRRAEAAQLVGVGGPSGCEDLDAARESDLHRAAAHHRAAAVDQERLPALHAEGVERVMTDGRTSGSGSGHVSP